MAFSSPLPWANLQLVTEIQTENLSYVNLFFSVLFHIQDRKQHTDGKVEKYLGFKHKLNIGFRHKLNIQPLGSM